MTVTNEFLGSYKGNKYPIWPFLNSSLSFSNFPLSPPPPPQPYLSSPSLSPPSCPTSPTSSSAPFSPPFSAPIRIISQVNFYTWLILTMFVIFFQLERNQQLGNLMSQCVCNGCCGLARWISSRRDFPRSVLLRWPPSLRPWKGPLAGGLSPLTAPSTSARAWL